jgi:3-hydroxybutyryl-CoA dehydrogenase
MMLMSGARIAVIGAGRMGHGIGWRLAAAGHAVRIQDPDQGVLAALPARLDEIRHLLEAGEDIAGRVSGTSDLRAAVENADFVFEAAPENVALKQALFQELEELAPRHAILCSNTSAIPIAQIAARVQAKDRVAGTHFWNPPYLVDLVEVVLMGEANRPAAEKAATLLREAGAHPVFVNRDIPGFIGNRLQHALKREAIALVAAGICDAETIDDVVKHGFGARLGVLGPMEQSDLVGLDMTKAIHDVLIADLDRTPGTHPYLDDLVARGNLGMKTGKGFRTWSPEEAAAVGDRLRRFLVKAARSGL